jgi:hypothetical protein
LLSTQEVPVAHIDSLAALPLGRQLADLIRRPALGVRVWISRRQLDEELIAGADPNSRPALALRTTQLLDPRLRRRLAATLERLIDEFDAHSPQLSAAVPFQRDQVAQARAVLPWLAYELRTAESIQPRGVAMVDRLLRDVTGPLYVRNPPAALQRRAQEIYDCLVGDQPV